MQRPLSGLSFIQNTPLLTQQRNRAENLEEEKEVEGKQMEGGRGWLCAFLNESRGLCRFALERTSPLHWLAGASRGGAGLRGPSHGAELAFEPRPHFGPAPSRRALAAPPAASGGPPGRCDGPALGAAASVAAGTLAAAVRRVAGQSRLNICLLASHQSHRSCRWVRRGQQDFGFSSPECFHSAVPPGPLWCLRTQETSRERRARTLQTWRGGGLSLRSASRGLDSGSEVRQAVQSEHLPL